MVIIMVIIPKLGLKDIQDGNLGAYAQNKSDKINAEPAFAAVNPATGTVDTKKKAYTDELALVLDGTKADTSSKNVLRGELEELLTLQALDIARISGNDETLYLKSGYDFKDVKGHPIGELDATDTIVFRHYGKNAGELQPDWKPVVHARNYTAQVYTDVDHRDTSVVKEVTVNPSIALIGGMTSGARVWVRLRANGGSTGHGPWSSAVSKIVP